MEQAPKVEGTSSGTSALSAGLGVAVPPAPTFVWRGPSVYEKARNQRIGGSDGEMVEELCNEIDHLRATLKDIGDLAHDRSTGPAIEDALWEIRRIAYEAL